MGCNRAKRVHRDSLAHFVECPCVLAYLRCEQPRLLKEGGLRFFLGLAGASDDEAKVAALFGRAAISAYHCRAGEHDLPSATTAELIGAELRWLARRHA
eukprot:3709801-Lingulodinium_polyedra.AAC.1